MKLDDNPDDDYGARKIGANHKVTTYASERGGVRPGEIIARAGRVVANAKNVDRRNTLAHRQGAV